MLVCLLLLLSYAAWTDIRTGRVSNRLIVSGLFTGCIWKFYQYGWIGGIHFLTGISVPVLMLYLLFLMHALGAGDIKLFSVIGGCIGFYGVIRVMLFALFAGALLAVPVLWRNRNLYARLSYFSTYVKTAVCTKSVPVYDAGSDGKQNYIHFSAAILTGFLVWLGGM